MTHAHECMAGRPKSGKRGPKVLQAPDVRSLVVAALKPLHEALVEMFTPGSGAFNPLSFTDACNMLRKVRVPGEHAAKILEAFEVGIRHIGGDYPVVRYLLTQQRDAWAAAQAKLKKSRVRPSKAILKNSDRLRKGKLPKASTALPRGHRSSEEHSD